MFKIHKIVGTISEAGEIPALSRNGDAIRLKSDPNES